MSKRIYWRCFHCGETFTRAQVKCAREHFGHDETAEPVCLIRTAGESALLTALRRAEDELAEWRAELNPTLNAMIAMACDHAQALRREEERGYARGLADARAEMGASQVPDPAQPIVDAHFAGHPAPVSEGSAGERGWRPIETAPKDGTSVLLSCDGMTGLGWWVDERFGPGEWRAYSFEDCDNWQRCIPVAWMPVPEPLPWGASLRERKAMLVVGWADPAPHAAAPGTPASTVFLSMDHNGIREGLTPSAADEEPVDWRARALAAEARAERLAEGLRPFAALAEMHDRPDYKDTDGIIFPASKACVKMGDLRRAAAVLADREERDA